MTLDAFGAGRTLLGMQDVARDVEAAGFDALWIPEGGLPVCEAYMIVDVLHDWTDDEAGSILKSVRDAAPANAKLLIIEALLPGHLAQVIDIHMMTYMTGRKRTQAEFARLVEAAGFRFARVVEAPPYAVVESVAA